MALWRIRSFWLTATVSVLTACGASCQRAPAAPVGTTAHPTPRPNVVVTSLSAWLRPYETVTFSSVTTGSDSGIRQ